MKRIKALMATALLAASCTPLFAENFVYENNFNSYDEFLTCSVYDANNDWVSWDWREYDGKTFACCYGTSDVADMISSDDWLITPDIQLLKGHSYRMWIEAQCLNETQEKIECKWGSGTHIQQFTGTAIAPLVMDETFYDAQTVKGQRINIVNDGNYKFACHMMSDFYSAGVAILSIKVEDLGLTSEIDSEPTMVFNEEFPSASWLGYFSIRNVNGDSSTWNSSTLREAAQYTYHSKNAADDHLITPAIPLQVGRNYKLKFKAEALSEVEKIEVLMGTSNLVKDLTTELIPPKTIGKKQTVTLQNELFTVSKSGNYYISFHAISDADADKLWVDDIEVWDMGPNGEKEEEVTPPVDNSLPIPYTADLTDPEVFADYAVIDANFDNSTWKYIWLFNVVGYSFSKTHDADDWLITPELKFEKGKNYRMTVTAASRGVEYPEKFEVVMGHGTDLDTYKKKVMAPVTVNMNVKDPTVLIQSEPFSVDETAAWNLGIHAISLINMSDLLIYKVEVEELDLSAPRSVTALDALPDDKGQLKVTIKYNAPTQNYGGEQISTVSKIETYRGDVLVDTHENVKAGQQVYFEDSDQGIIEGLNQYTVIPYINGNAGEVSQINVYVGSDVPLKLTGVRGKDLGTSALIEWNPASNIGENGRVVYTDLVEYNIYEVETEIIAGIPYITGYKHIKKVKGTSAEISVPAMNTGNFRMIHYAVSPETGAGEGAKVYVNFLAGKPSEMPYYESFPGGTPSSYYSIDTDCQLEESYLYGSTISADDDNGACSYVSYEGSKFIALFLPKVAVKGSVNPTLSLQAMNKIGNNTLKVLVMTPDNVQHEVHSTKPGDSYTTYTVDLSAYNDNLWVRPIIAVEFPFLVDPDWGNELLVDDIRLFDKSAGIEGVSLDVEKSLIFPCDVYSVDGQLIRKNAESLEGLQGVVIINGHKFILR